MKAALLIIILFFTLTETYSQKEQWTWMSGDNTVGTAPVYGTKGVPSIDNKPGSRTGAASWTDAGGNLWLFGGTSSNNPFGYRNDLWKYNTATNEWTWVGGADVTNNSGVYGPKNISSQAYLPCSRMGATNWTDVEGNFWIFGGEGMIQDFFSGTSLNDLWKYNPKTNEWTWVNGQYTPGRPYPGGSFGVKGVAAPDNNPVCRYGGTGWVDKLGNFWLMGGYSFSGFLNDLWRYEPGKNQWVWMNGDNQAGSAGFYGSKGVEAAENRPGGRVAASGWTDASGYLWLFGGSNNNSLFNDLWKYNTDTNQWAWIGGDNIPDQVGSYGTKGVASASNKLSSRASAVVWSDASNEFWMYGGSSYINNVYNSYSDLWKFDPKTNLFTWVSGDQLPNQQAVYGIKGISTKDNKPGERTEASDWIDKQGNLWFYGGYIYKPGSNRFYADMWKYSPFPSITTEALSSATFCSGNNLTVRYSVSESFNTSNIFTAELSDSLGSFSSPLQIGQIASTSGGSIIAKLPPDLPKGNQYRVRIVGSLPAVIGKESGTLISVISKPVISINASNTGPICKGEAITLLAQVANGVPPLNFEWSNQQTTAQITVHPENDTVFTVMVKNTGCGDVSSSIKLVVNNQLNANLGNDRTLCEGEVLKLRTTFAYKTYLWQDGSSDSVLLIDKPGTYSVLVHDACGSVSEDKIIISTASKPANFLGADTAKCDFESLVLRPLSPFENYTWSTGSTNNEINIKDIGLYWLRVTDKNKCVGIDSIFLIKKDCLKGVYVPNAFTPNNDGRNDVFKPVVQGPVTNYQFLIYNRWGQIVFKTTEVGEGWDGKISGHQNESNVFAWICTYQAPGESIKTEKGTVIIVK